MEGRALHDASSGKGDGGILKAGGHGLVTDGRRGSIDEGRRETEDGRRETGKAARLGSWAVSLEETHKSPRFLPSFLPSLQRTMVGPLLR